MPSRSFAFVWLLTLLLIFHAGEARALAIYADFLTVTGNGAPSSSFGAAAVDPGQWNNVSGTENFTSTIFDVLGNPTGVTLGVSGAGGFNNDHFSTSGDVEKLLDDGLDSTASFTITVRDLPAGIYDVYTYGWHPANDGASTVTRISVNGLPTQDVSRDATFTSFQQGITHALHSVTLDGATDLVISATGVGVNSTAVVNGIQIVPEPSTAALLYLGTAALALRRRSKLARR